MVSYMYSRYRFRRCRVKKEACMTTVTLYGSVMVVLLCFRPQPLCAAGAWWEGDRGDGPRHQVRSEGPLSSPVWGAHCEHTMAQ